MAPRPSRHLHRHVETLVIGGGRRRPCAAADEATGRVLLLDEGPVVLEPPANATTLGKTTATGIYDDGYVLCYQRDGATDVFHHVRARARGARDGRARTPARVRRERPARRDARLGRPGLPRALRRARRRTDRGLLGEPRGSRGSRGARRRRRQSSWSSIPAPKAGRATERLRAAGIEVRLNATGRRDRRRSRAHRRHGVRRRRPTHHDPRGRARRQRRLEPGRPARARARHRAALRRGRRRASCTTAPGPTWLTVVGAAAGDVPASFPIWVVDDGDDAREVRRAPARPDRRRRRGGGRRPGSRTPST